MMYAAITPIGQRLMMLMMMPIAAADYFFDDTDADVAVFRWAVIFAVWADADYFLDHALSM